MAWPITFGSLPAGNVPASDLDQNFNAAVLGAANSTDGFLVQFSGTTGKVIQNGGFDPSGLSGQIQSLVTGAVATGSTAIPVDDTIPQNTEGTEFMALAITPASATSTLEITISFNYGVASQDNLVLAVFRDSGVNAIAATCQFTQASTNTMNLMSFTFTVSSAATAATTFHVRGGTGTGVMVTFNGTGGTRLFGGVTASSIVIREVL